MAGENIHGVPGAGGFQRLLDDLHVGKRVEGGVK